MILNKYLWIKYSPANANTPLLHVPLTDYLIPSHILNLPKDLRACISGGIQFHSEFEDYLLLNSFEIHAFEIDPQSWQWCDNKHGNNSSFILHRKGLFSEHKVMPFFGDKGRNTSPSILNNFHDDPSVDEIGRCELISLKAALTECNIQWLALAKLDIEGVALKVISKALDDKLPVQCFVFEAERPIGRGSDHIGYFIELIQLLYRLELDGYTVLCYRRNDEFNSFSTLCTAFKTEIVLDTL